MAMGRQDAGLCGIDKVRKRCSLAAAVHNLSVLMRTLFGIGTPRSLQQRSMALAAALSLVPTSYLALRRPITTIWNRQNAIIAKSHPRHPAKRFFGPVHNNRPISTGC
jgi:hypothetical protein